MSLISDKACEGELTGEDWMSFFETGLKSELPGVSWQDLYQEMESEMGSMSYKNK